MADANGASILVSEAIRSGKAARPARLAVARGAFPLTPSELLRLQLLLLSDPDAEVVEAAQESLNAVSAELAAQAATDPESDPAVLEFLAGRPQHWPAAAAVLACSTRVRPAALRPIAGCALPDALAALAGNELALAADAALGRLLAENPSLPSHVRGRLLDYLDELAKEAPAPAPAPVAIGAAAERPLARDAFLAALGIDAEVEALLPELGLDVGQLAERSELLGEAESEAELRLIQRLARLNVGQKLRAALFAGREERSILIRDTNRIVAAAVVKNPKFSEQEAEAAASSRNVNEEVLRLIARRREFACLYTVQHNLVRNPRCPPSIATALAPQLHDRDLKLLTKNRNVTEAVRRQAKKAIDAREARQRGRRPSTKH